MKASTVIAIATGLTASLVSAQLDSIPPCALTCALAGLGDTGCGSADIACICGATSFVSGLLPCVQKSCDAALIQDTIAAASELCAGAGVTLSIPTAAPTSAPDTSATSGPTSATTTLSTVVSSTETSAPGTETTAAPTATGPTSSANGTISTTGSQPPAPTQTQGSSASRNTIALGGLGAVLALVAALL